MKSPVLLYHSIQLLFKYLQKPDVGERSEAGSWNMNREPDCRFQVKSTEEP